MKLYKSFHALTRGNLIVLGIELGALYWIFESGIHAFAFQKGNFFQQIFIPEAHEIWMRVFVILILFIFGAITQTVLAKHKRAEQALREQRSREQEYLDIAGVILVVLDGRGNITLINKKGCEVLGYTDTELLGKSWFETCLPKGIREEVSSVYRKLMEGELGLVKYYENPVLTAKGEERTIAWHNTILRDAFGKITGTLSSGEDITERKQAEEALRESSERLRILFDNLTIGVYRTTPDGQILVANSAMVKLLGYSSFEELAKRNLEEEGFNSSCPRNQFKEAIERDGEVRGFESAWEKDGYIIYIRENARAIRGKDGKTLCYEGTAEDITERKEVEDALRESEERFRTLLETAYEGGGIHEQGRLVEVNQALASKFGYEASEMIGMEASQFFAPESRQLVEENIRTGFDKPYEVVAVRKDGSTFPIEIIGKSCRYQGRQVRMSAIRDITERKRAEEALKESEEKFRMLSDQSLMGIIILQDELFVYVNDRAAKIVEVSAEEIANWSPGDYAKLIHPDDLAFVMEQGRKKQAGEKETVTHYNWRMITHEGNLKWIEMWSKSISFASRTADMIMMIDITERKRAEEALKESETKYRFLIENSNDAIYLLVDEKFELVNPKFLEIFDITFEDLQAPDFNYMRLVAPRSHPLIEERNRKWELGEELPSRYEFTGVRKDGKEIDLEASVVRIPYRGGMATQGILRDITERKKMETQLRQTQKMEAMGTLAGGIAHDFNNILMAMLGYSDMARQDIPKDSPARVSLKAVFEAGERAKDLVNQILTFSRQTEHERQPVKIHPIVKEALKLLRASLPTTIEIRQNIDTNCGIILADPTQIHQIMMNLCTNAFHAMREKGGVLDVSLKNVEVDASYVEAYPQLSPGKYIRLVVSDTGCGMDKATMARIFDPFFTSKAVGEGTGMGLSTVHGIVKSHEGAITVYSEPGKGSAFNVYFPALKTETVTEIPPDEPVTRGEESILFVDDEVQLAELGQRMLEFMGYHVTIRTSSVEALEAFRATPDKFDLVISDLTMPNMTGMELAEEIMRIRPDIPVILATGFSETVTPEKARKVGVSLYLNKPIILSELGKAVRQVLDATAQEK